MTVSTHAKTAALRLISRTQGFVRIALQIAAVTTLVAVARVPVAEGVCCVSFCNF